MRVRELMFLWRLGRFSEPVRNRSGREARAFIVACRSNWDEAAGDENHVRGEKRVVIRGGAEPLDHMVQIENGMIDEAFHEIEQAPAEEKRAEK